MELARHPHPAHQLLATRCQRCELPALELWGARTSKCEPLRAADGGGRHRELLPLQLPLLLLLLLLLMLLLLLLLELVLLLLLLL